ncbi:ABC transporter ATP-binding protein [Sporanaerobium hydrogeniformans]|uniref:ABC transporter ATP-binding protein n=1 Tax=Sporanaerobium hydrogeniformans TaxID=3072179 RepID=A0AC61DAE5_9FIRM|nr:ABC transporter ATP-binding protein [Sporanaerobium hydrogeniformans]PHV69715.1 ABC transporter ATP-binding protein [Sporanaerobium hydrogeniformans]
MKQKILEARKITKVYPGGVVANHEVQLDIYEGEIHALVGENGAGKSTLMKMLFGMTSPTSGEIFIRDEQVEFTSSKDAIAKGIGMVHQHFMQVPSMTVAENLILGAEPTKKGLVDRKEAVNVTEKLSKAYNLKVDAKAQVENISLAMRQKLEILKALYRGAKILILDEPTAVLTPQETEELFEQLKLLREKGHTIIFISHKLNEVKALCNRMTILRDGKTMGTYEMSDLTEQEISRLMVGRDVNLNMEKSAPNFGKTVISVKDLVYVNQFGKQKVDHVSFSIREGQILGIAGIDGNGQSELVEVIVGALKQSAGEIRLKGQDISKLPILKRQEAGISHVSEDRMKYGSAPKLSLEDNAISKIYYTNELKSYGLLSNKKIAAFTERILKDFKVKYDHNKQSIGELSGGNIQKLIVGREYEYNPELLIINQPTRGVDVGAIEFIRKKILDMRERRKAILLVSADLSEILSLSDSILVMHEGKIVGYIEDAKTATENELGLYMLGVKQDSKEKLGGAYHE